MYTPVVYTLYMPPYVHPVVYTPVYASLCTPVVYSCICLPVYPGGIPGYV